jgi:hypothetical protein
LKHGNFFQKAYSHLQGKGCDKCGGTYQLSNQMFVDKAFNIHKYKYDYFKVNYKNNRTKVEIVCRKHGSFFQIPNSHLMGEGCPKCSGLVKLTTEEFIKKANLKHFGKYDYCKVNYKNSRTKIDIICPAHGIFTQKPNTHLNGSGCPVCSHYVSKPEIEFLNYVNVNDRQKTLFGFSLDGIDMKNKTIYEFLGNYYHGNPSIYSHSDFNHKCQKTFGELYDNTLKKFEILKNRGYTIKYIWESDWKTFKRGLEHVPNIIEF